LFPWARPRSPSSFFKALNLALFAKTHYDVLGVSPRATRTEIRTSFLRLIISFHPDKDQSDGARAAEINEAYNVLVDDEKRAAYDQALRQTRRDPSRSFQAISQLIFL
jgi:curved DNA-binding protein CbpA